MSLKKYTKATKKSNFSSQFLRMQKNQLIDLKLNLERYVITLLEFEFNSGRYELKLIKSYVIPWVQQHHQTSFLKPRKQVRPKTFFLMGGLTVPTRSRMKCYLHTKPFSVNWKTTTPLIKTLGSIRTWYQVDLIGSKHYRNFMSSQYLHGIITIIYRRFGRNIKWLHLKIFLPWYNNKDVLTILGAEQKMV